MSPDDYSGLHSRYAALLGDDMELATNDPIDKGLREKLKEAFKAMMRALYQEEGASLRIGILAEPAAQEFITTHSDTLDSSFKQVKMSDIMRQRLSRSNYVFSGMKAFHELNEAFPSLLDENGNRKTFERFLKDVRSIDATYNSNYLRSEFNFVQASAEMAAKWEGFMQDGDRYYLQYRTAHDNKVRPEHAALHGVTLPITDSFWEEYYPPNGWNCFTGRTPVLTPGGWKPIEEIMKGELVVGGSGQFRVVVGTHAKTVDEELVRVVTKGAVAACTKNHRFCTPHGWVTADSLKPGDILIQVGKNSALHKVVNAIGNMHAILRHALMTRVAQRKTVAPLAVYHKVKGRDVEVRDIRAKKLTCLEWKGFCREVITHDFFGLAEWLAEGAHAFGMKPAGRYGTAHALDKHFRTVKGAAFLEFLRNAADKIAVRFGFSLTDMLAHKGEVMIDAGKAGAGGQTAGRSVDPLRAHGIAAVTKGNAQLAKNAEHGAVVDVPVCGKPARAALLKQVTPLCGITDIHAFNGFNSFLDFIRHTFFHNRYVLVEGKVNIKKSETTVFNLSIDKDEAYVVPVGITHNCRCTVVQVRKSRYPATPHDEAVALGEEALQRDTKGMFRFNSGKEEKAVPDYNPYTISRCRDCDIAKGKQNLRKKPFIPDNELCQACQLLRKCAADKTKSERAIERTHYLHTMEPLLKKSVTLNTENTDIRVGFTKYGNKHLFSDTFGRSSVMTKDDLATLDKVLETASFIGSSPLTHPRNDGIDRFFYYEATIREQKVRLNVAKQVYRRPTGQIETRFFLYSINDI